MPSIPGETPGPPRTLAGLLSSALVDAALDENPEVSGLSYDHRTLVSGDLFCCIPGKVVDGHDFGAAAAGAGAAALLVERRLDVDIPQAVVERVRPVLGPLSDAFYGHPSGELTIAGVTGTNGKTTVTYLLESIAATAGRRPGVIGTVSRRYGSIEEAAPRNTPEAPDVQALLRRMADAGVDVVAMEATSDGLEQGRLRGTRFATAGFTNLTQDHLNTHGTMDAYFAAKSLLFDRAYTDRAVINVDDAHGRQLASRVRESLDVVTYGDGGDISVSDVRLSSDGSLATMQTPWGAVAISTTLVGRYNVTNCMCALGLAAHCGFSLGQIVEGIEALRIVPGRLENVDAGQPFLALVDYAHTPDALEHALRACRELADRARGRVLVVFGCGGDRDRSKRPLMGEAATSIADLSFVTSDNPRTEDPQAILDEVVVGAARGGGAYRAVVDRREAIALALSEARDGDIVLVAGKGHEQGQQFADRTIPFDDREVVRELLESLCRS
jgi:UDP-N-acetylmuramoyl-L-alanyl-D-glutamate--2,6-diaminopimelate ligase